MESDGFSLDDHRKPLLSSDKLGVKPSTKLTKDELVKNNLPNILSKWSENEDKKNKYSRTEQSFVVKKEEKKNNDYDLSLNIYRKVIYQNEQHTSPTKLISEIKILEEEIQVELKKLEKAIK